MEMDYADPKLITNMMRVEFKGKRSKEGQTACAYMLYYGHRRHRVYVDNYCNGGSTPFIISYGKPMYLRPETESALEALPR